MIRLIAKNPDNLLSVLINREINIDQAHLINLLIDVTERAEPAQLEELEFLFTHALQTELPPREGLEQYQAEDR